MSEQVYSMSTSCSPPAMDKLRALARGDDPEEVIRRIADYRADDKHDPDYARYTVSKAQGAGYSRAWTMCPS